MESKPKTDTVKSKRFSKKSSAHTDNSSCKDRNKNAENKLILKRRGLYVERNPGKLEINEVFVQKSYSRSSQRDYPPTILTSSTVGNQNSLTHEVVKSKRRVRKSNPVSRQKSKDQSKDNSIKSKDNSFKGSKEESKDGIVYVLQSRTNRGQSFATTDSFKSKRTHDDDLNYSSISFRFEDSDNINNIPSGSFDSGIDRLAAQILQGWITRKETDENPNKPASPDFLHKTNEDLYSLSLNLAAAAGTKVENLREFPSCSKHARPIDAVPEKDSKRITFDVSDHSNISAPRFANRKFQVAEHEVPFSKQPISKRPTVKVKPRLKTDRIQLETRIISDVKKPTMKMKRNAKKEFISIIKRELMKSDRIPEEPRSMFDALKMVAKNKRFSNRRVCLDLSDTDCKLQSSKLIATGKGRFNGLKSRSLNNPISTQPKTRWYRKVPKEPILNRNSKFKKAFPTY